MFVTIWSQNNFPLVSWSILWWPPTSLKSPSMVHTLFLCNIPDNCSKSYMMNYCNYWDQAGQMWCLDVLQSRKMTIDDDISARCDVVPCACYGLQNWARRRPHFCVGIRTFWSHNYLSFFSLQDGAMVTSKQVFMTKYDLILLRWVYWLSTHMPTLTMGPLESHLILLWTLGFLRPFWGGLQLLGPKPKQDQHCMHYHWIVEYIYRSRDAEKTAHKIKWNQFKSIRNIKLNQITSSTWRIRRIM